MSPFIPFFGIIGLCLTFAVPGLAQEWTRFRDPKGMGIGIAQTSVGGATTRSGGWKAEDKAQKTDGIEQKTGHPTAHPAALDKVRLSSDGRHLVTTDGQPFVAFGVNYYRPGTGWAPQVWKQFDRDASQRDFERLRDLGGNCVRIFLTFGSFYTEPGRLDPDGLAKFDQFLELAEATGIYVHPTGPDHWEGLPEWARGDRIADDRVLEALESFWRLFAARYRGRTVLLGYDLLNEPEVRWDSPVMRVKWNRWLEQQYGTAGHLAATWQISENSIQFGAIGPPEPKDAPGDRRLLDYQRFREELADDWTRRQVAAIKSVDPDALVTVGLIQWSVPSLLPVVSHYSGFRPERQAQFLDFLSVHFYPLDRGAYEYSGDEEEARNLAYLESVVREVALPGKPVVIGEFGWYGGGQPRFDQGRHPAATEEQQARWCRRLVETTAGLATGWLNWGFHDHPQAGDVSELTGLLTVDGEVKAWGREFQQLTDRFSDASWPSPSMKSRPPLNWDDCLTSIEAGHQFRQRYYRSFLER